MEAYNDSLYYTDKPTHLRVFREENFWNLDGADNEGHYTEDVRAYVTRQEAFDSIESFIKDNESIGVVFKWDKARSTRLRHNTIHGEI